MSDQMPDEVWIERPRWDGWGERTTKRVENPRVHRVRYIRADLYEQAEAERDRRLRAALERLMRGEGGVNSLEQERIAQEALDQEALDHG